MSPSKPSQGADPYAEDAAGEKTLEALEEAVRYNNWLCGHVRPYLGQANVEIGAGHGTLTAIIGRTHRVLPVEPSETGRARLSQRFAEHVRVLAALPLLSDVPEEAAFDCIYSSNVLEHIEDDLETLSQACTRLRPGGHFVALVPAGMWLYSDFDRVLGHLRRYTQNDRQRIERYLEERVLPLRLLRYRTLNPIGALGWFLKARLLGQTCIRPRDAAMVERLVPLFSMIDKLPLPFGQTVLFVLQKHPA